VSTPVVIHNRDLSRYEAHLDGALAGFADYKLTNSLIVFPHTEVDPAFGGQGVGGAIVQFALDDVRAAGTHKVMPVCPFVKAWIERHPDYADLVHGA